MITPELVRWYAAVAGDAVTGLDIIAALVPRAVGDDPPPLVAIYNAVDDNWVARGAPVAAADLDPALWTLTIALAPSLTFGRDPESKAHGNATVILLLTGMPQDAEDAAATASGYRLMRGLRYCVNKAWLPYEGDGLELDQQRFTLDGDGTLEVAEVKNDSDVLVGFALTLDHRSTDHWLFSTLP